MLQLLHALHELFALDPELDPAEADEVLREFDGRQLAGLFLFSTPSVGLIAATDEAVVQIMGFAPTLIVTTLAYADLEQIRHAGSPEDGVELVAFSGTVLGERVAVSAVIDSGESGPARRLIGYVSGATNVPVT